MGYWAYDGTGNQWWVPTEGDPGYVAPAAPVSVPVTQGQNTYDMFNLGADNWVKGSDGNYYKQTGPQYNMEGMLQSAMGIDPTPYTAQQLQSMGATSYTNSPEYNIDDGTMTGLMGAGLLFGGLGAFGGLGGLFGGESLPTMGLDDLAVSSISGSAAPTAEGLSWLGNSGLPSITDAVSAFNPSSLGGASGAYNPGAVMDAAINNYVASNPGSTATTAAKALGLMKPDGSWDMAKIASAGLSGIGGLLSGNAAQSAAQTASNTQLEAARIAAEAARFKPVGVTTNFGQSKFTTDAQGNVTGAGYTLNPTLQAQQNQLLGASSGLLNQFTGAQAATAPMGAGAQSLFNLGQGYLSTTPQQQAAKYYADQQALLATNRERDRAALENRLQQQGRLGLATGATGAMTAANPEMEAFYNAQRQQDLGLAAQATQGGMDYAKFGAGMLGTGGDLLRSMYGTQTASFDPYKTALGGAQTIEGLGQNALDLSINIGKTASPAQSGALLAQGMNQAAQTMQPANAYSPWGALLSGAGNALGTMAQPQQQQSMWAFDPYTGRALG